MSRGLEPIQLCWPRSPMILRGTPARNPSFPFPTSRTLKPMLLQLSASLPFLSLPPRTSAISVCQLLTYHRALLDQSLVSRVRKRSGTGTNGFCRTT